MGLITFYHSCGSIGPVIEDLIEMGNNLYNFIQKNYTWKILTTKLEKFFDKIVKNQIKTSKGIN